MIVANRKGNCGVANGRAKLDAEKVSEIRIRCAQGHGFKQVAAEFGITPSTVSKIHTGRIWAGPDAQPVKLLTVEELRERKERKKTALRETVRKLSICATRRWWKTSQYHSRREAVLVVFPSRSAMFSADISKMVEVLIDRSWFDSLHDSLNFLDEGQPARLDGTGKFPERLVMRITGSVFRKPRYTNGPLDLRRASLAFSEFCDGEDFRHQLWVSDQPTKERKQTQYVVFGLVGCTANEKFFDLLANGFVPQTAE